MTSLKKPKTPPLETWLAEVPGPYRHCTTCKHHRANDYPFGFCAKGLHQADDEGCAAYRTEGITMDVLPCTNHCLAQKRFYSHDKYTI